MCEEEINKVAEKYDAPQKLTELENELSMTFWGVEGFGMKLEKSIKPLIPLESRYKMKKEDMFLSTEKK